MPFVLATCLMLISAIGAGVEAAFADDVQQAHRANEPAKTKAAEARSPYFLDPAFDDLFLRPTILYSGGGYKNRIFHYRLFVPDTLPSGSRFPLIVWLHGWGEGGDDNCRHLLYFNDYFLSPPWDRERYPYFIVAVQCPSKNQSWTTDSPDADDMVNVCAAIIDKTLADYPAIDANRVVLSGVSSGGSGCWELAIRRPELFAAVAPLASGGGDLSRIDRLAKIPVWAFHSQYDKAASIEPDRQTVAALKAAGGCATLTEVNMTEHGCWTPAFMQYDLLTWLLGQERGRTPVEPPGTITMAGRMRSIANTVSNTAARWKPWQIAVQIGVPALIVLVVWSVYRTQKLGRRT